MRNIGARLRRAGHKTGVPVGSRRGLHFGRIDCGSPWTKARGVRELVGRVVVRVDTGDAHIHQNGFTVRGRCVEARRTVGAEAWIRHKVVGVVLAVDEPAARLGFERLPVAGIVVLDIRGGLRRIGRQDRGGVQ